MSVLRRASDIAGVAGRPDGRADAAVPPWERVALVLLAAAVAGHHLLVYQPVTARADAVVYPPEVAEAARQVPYAALEDALARLRFNAAGELIIDGGTEAVLRAAREAVPPRAGEQAAARAAFLIGEQFPPPQARQVETLLGRFSAYLDAELAWRQQQPEPDSLREDAAQFDQLAALQDRELGPALAEQLFGEQRRLMRYMFAARELEDDDTLSAEEKQARLQQLQRVLQTTDDAD